MNISKINGLLKTTTHHDKDERFMATSDIITELERVSEPVPGSLQAPVRNALLNQLEDSSSDVQTVAVKGLSVLVQKVDGEQVADIVVRLAHLIIDPRKKESRDIYGIGLKTILQSVDDASGANLAPKLLAVFLGNEACSGKQGADIELTLLVLDIVKDILQRFGGVVALQHAPVLQVLGERLQHPKDNVRKRAIATLGVLVLSIDEEVFQSVMELLIKELSQTSQPASLRYTFIQAIGVVCQSAGARVGKYLSTIVPRLEQLCRITNKDTEASAEVIELWENCLQAFESIVLRCPAEAAPYINGIVDACLQFVAYDPNYSYDEDEDMGTEAKEEEDGACRIRTAGGGWSDGEQDDEEWGGGEDAPDLDDDISWKVRSAAVRCLTAFVHAGPVQLKDSNCERICDSLVARFKERDNNVQIAIFGATCALLKESVVYKGNVAASAPIPAIARVRPSFAVLTGRISQIIAQADKQIRKSQASNDVKLAVFNLFSQLVIVRQGQLQTHLSLLIRHGVEGASSDDVRLKAAGLGLLHYLLASYQAKDLEKQLPSITKAVIGAMQQPLVKIKAKAIRVCGEIVALFTSATVPPELAKQLYDAAYQQLLLTDVDQEVKEACLVTIALIVSHLGQHLADAGHSLPIIVSRLNNELTRHSALRALTMITQARVCDMSPMLEQCLPLLVGFLRKDSQTLRIDTVHTLAALVSVGMPIEPDSLIVAICPLISDQDLRVSSLVLELACLLLCSDLQPATINMLIERVLRFLKSSVLQGDPLLAVIAVVQRILTLKIQSCAQLLTPLLECVDDKSSLSSCRAIAQCVAALAKESDGDAITQRFTANVMNPAVSRQGKQIALLVLGEIAREVQSQSNAEVETAVFSAFSSEHDEVRRAASVALGNIVAGSLPQLLPVLLSRIDQEANQRYLLLYSLKEVISHFTGLETRKLFLPYVESVTTRVFQHVESKEESERSMVAECLGGLGVIDSVNIFSEMEKWIDRSSAHVRGVAISALRYALSPSLAASALPSPRLSHFLTLLKDPDLVVRRQCLMTVNALAHSHVELIESLLETQILPALYNSTIPDASHTRVVDYGPFKHKIDDGLPIRKGAYQALSTLLDTASHHMHIPTFIKFLKEGLLDHDDIQASSYAVLEKIALSQPDPLQECLDTLPEPIMEGLKKKLKEAKEAEPERAIGVLRAAVRCLYTIHLMPGVQKCKAFCDFYLRVLKTPLLAKLLEETLKQ